MASHFVIRHDTTIDMRLCRNWLRIALIGTAQGTIDQVAYGAFLVSDAISDALHLTVLGVSVGVPEEYVGVLPATGQLLGLVLLWRWRRRSRVFVSVLCSGGAATGITVAAVAPSGATLAGGIFAASVFSVAIFPVWSRVLDAVPKPAPKTQASAVLIASYAGALWLLGLAFDVSEERHGISVLFGWFGVAIVGAGTLIAVLTPPEDAGRAVAQGRFRDELRDRRGLVVIVIALLSGMALTVHDAQVTPLYQSVGLDREAAALTGLAFPIGGLVGLVVAVVRPTALRFKLVLAAMALPLTFLAMGWPHLLAGTGITLLNLMLIARTGLEASTTLTTAIGPTWRGEIMFMIVLQVGRGVGKLAGAINGGIAFDSGGRHAAATLGTVVGAASVVLAVLLLRRPAPAHAALTHAAHESMKEEGSDDR